MEIQLAPSSSDPNKRKESDVDDDDDDELVAKRQKLSSPPTKLCIVCRNLSDTGDSAYDVIIADLNSSCYDASNTNDGFISISPTFRLERGADKQKGFCVLGSTLYIFDSTAGKNEPPRKSVHTVDLSNRDFTSRILAKSELGNTVPDMHHPKKSPSAVPTHDGKILVFSAVISLHPFDEMEVADFEVYDPDAGTWESLPGIRYDWKGYCREHNYRNHFRINGFTFVAGGSTFVVQTNTGFMFSLDLGCVEKGWRRMDTFFGGEDIPFYKGRSFVIGDDQLCVTPHAAYDVSKGREKPDEFLFPLAPYDEDDIQLFGPSVVTVFDGVEDGSFRICNLESGIGRETRHPYLIMSSFSYDRNKYEEDKMRMGEGVELGASIKAGERLSFRVDGMKCALFLGLGLFLF